MFWLTDQLDGDPDEDLPMEELKEEIILLITAGMFLMHLLTWNYTETDFCFC